MSHIATCAGVLDNRVQVWDTHHPHIPVATFEGHQDVVTGMVWTSQDDQVPEGEEAKSDEPEVALGSRPALVTVSKDGYVVWHDGTKAVRPHLSLRSTAVSFGPRGWAWVHDPMDRWSYWDVGANPFSSEGEWSPPPTTSTTLADAMPPSAPYQLQRTRGSAPPIGESQSTIGRRRQARRHSGGNQGMLNRVL